MLDRDYPRTNDPAGNAVAALLSMTLFVAANWIAFCAITTVLFSLEPR